MTKADLVEQVTAAMARTSGPLISKKDCAQRGRCVPRRDQERAQGAAQHRSTWLRHFQDPPPEDPHGAESPHRRAGGSRGATGPVFKPSKELRALVADEPHEGLDGPDDDEIG
jgi:integration host factor subunit beta